MYKQTPLDRQDTLINGLIMIHVKSLLCEPFYIRIKDTQDKSLAKEMSHPTFLLLAKVSLN